MTPKRRHESHEDPELTPESPASILCNLIRKTPGQNVGEVIMDMARHENLTLQDLKELSETPPAFASIEWENVAIAFGLDPTVDKYQLLSFSISRAYLPPSFHQRVMKDSIQWLDVYQERGSHNRETARVRLMDAWFVPVCALFKGRLVDKPENAMPGTLETSGGEVAHKVYMLQGIILLVVELKLTIKNEIQHVAEVLLDLASAYKLNCNKEFDPQPPVYAILTDLKDFYFFSYDGSTFRMDKEIRVSAATRAEFFNGMADATERLFSILLEGYASILDAVVKRSYHRGTIGDGSRSTIPPNVENPLRTASKFQGVRPSLDSWTKAAKLAREAQTILVECDCSSLGVWECSGQLGLRQLEASVSQLTKIGSLIDWDQEQITREIENVVRSRCKPYVRAPMEDMASTK